MADGATGARDIPLIADGYPNISQALTYGSPSGLGTMLYDAQFRLRSTSYWAMDALWQVTGDRNFWSVPLPPAN